MCFSREEISLSVDGSGSGRHEELQSRSRLPSGKNRGQIERISLALKKKGHTQRAVDCGATAAAAAAARSFAGAAQCIKNIITKWAGQNTRTITPLWSEWKVIIMWWQACKLEVVQLGKRRSFSGYRTPIPGGCWMFFSIRSPNSFLTSFTLVPGVLSVQSRFAIVVSRRADLISRCFNWGDWDCWSRTLSTR